MKRTAFRILRVFVCFSPGSLGDCSISAVAAALVLWNTQPRRKREKQCFLFHQLEVVIMPRWAAVCGRVEEECNGFHVHLLLASRMSFPCFNAHLCVSKFSMFSLHSWHFLGFCEGSWTSADVHLLPRVCSAVKWSFLVQQQQQLVIKEAVSLREQKPAG